MSLTVHESVLGITLPHVASGAEIVIVRKGRVVLGAGGRAAAGELIFMPPAASMCAAAAGEVARATHFQFSESLAERLRAFLPPVVEVVRLEKFGDAVPRMLLEKGRLDPCSELALEAAVCQVVAHAQRIRSSSEDTDAGYSRGVAAAIDYARAHLHGMITLEELAGAARMSARRLSHRFSAELHQSPLAYVRELRVQEAERLLRESSLAIAEIAHRCGFYDHAHLSRVFREQLASTPADYRRNAVTVP